MVSERVRAILLASDPTRRRLLADTASAALGGLAALPRRALLAAARGA